EQHVVADLATETRVHVGRQQRSDHVAEMLDAVDVGQRTGNQNPGHDTCPLAEARRTRKNEKPFRAGGRARVSALASREWTRVNPSGQLSGGRAGAFASR